MQGRINTLQTLQKKIQQDPVLLVQQAESYYRNNLERVAQLLTRNEKQHIVLLAGPSSSGKTTSAMLLARRLRQLGNEAVTVSLDDFYKNNRDAPRFYDGTPDYETVHALDLAELERCFLQLIHEGKSELPVFDFTSGCRSETRKTVHLGEKAYIIVEGLHALNPLVCAQLPQENLYKVYVSVSSRIYNEAGVALLSKRDLRFLRRLVRDAQFRASPAVYTYMLWQGVLRGENAYLFPFKNTAHYKINSLHAYEPCLLRTYASPLLADAMQDERYSQNAAELHNKLQQFLPLDERYIPQDSLMREFIGPALDIDLS